MADNFIDLVVAGPDMSGTSTQIKDIADHLEKRGYSVKDIRGDEYDALFHADIFNSINYEYPNLEDFYYQILSTPQEKSKFLAAAFKELRDLKVAAMVNSPKFNRIDPKKADVWVAEEPTHRGAGQVNRAIEQNISQFGEPPDQVSAAHSHAVYRRDEALRFRLPVRNAGGIFVRSRSEESACYQVYDERWLPTGIRMDDYLKLPGHRYAFGYPPTHIFVAHAPSNWTAEDYVELKRLRSEGRVLDDYEANAQYQVFVNSRYASPWLEQLYAQACAINGSEPPEIYRFDMLAPKEEIKRKMLNILDTIVPPKPL